MKRNGVKYYEWYMTLKNLRFMFRIYIIKEFRFYGADDSTEGSMLDKEFCLHIRFISLLLLCPYLHL